MQGRIFALSAVQVGDFTCGSTLPPEKKMYRFGYFIGMALAILTVFGVPVVVFFGLQAAWHELNGINPNLAIALITGATTVIVSTTTVMVGRYYERKRDIEAHFRTAKIQMYEEFVREFLSLVTGSERTKDLTSFLREWQQKLVLTAGANVLGAYFLWKTKLRAASDSAAAVFAMDNFFRELRADVGQTSRGLEKGAFAHLILRNSELFLQMAKKNPKVTLSQLAEIEKRLGLAD
jgi:hypothetical protein